MNQGTLSPRKPDSESPNILRELDTKEERNSVNDDARSLTASFGRPSSKVASNPLMLTSKLKPVDPDAQSQDDHRNRYEGEIFRDAGSGDGPAIPEDKEGLTESIDSARGSLALQSQTKKNKNARPVRLNKITGQPIGHRASLVSNMGSPTRSKRFSSFSPTTFEKRGSLARMDSRAGSGVAKPSIFKSGQMKKPDIQVLTYQSPSKEDFPSEYDRGETAPFTRSMAIVQNHFSGEEPISPAKDSPTQTPQFVIGGQSGFSGQLEWTEKQRPRESPNRLKLSSQTSAVLDSVERNNKNQLNVHNRGGEVQQRSRSGGDNLSIVKQAEDMKNCSIIDDIQDEEYGDHAQTKQQVQRKLTKDATAASQLSGDKKYKLGRTHTKKVYKRVTRVSVGQKTMHLEDIGYQSQAPHRLLMEKSQNTLDLTKSGNVSFNFKETYLKPSKGSESPSRAGQKSMTEVGAANSKQSLEVVVNPESSSPRKSPKHKYFTHLQDPVALLRKPVMNLNDSFVVAESSFFPPQGPGEKGLNNPEEVSDSHGRAELRASQQYLSRIPHAQLQKNTVMTTQLQKWWVNNEGEEYNLSRIQFPSQWNSPAEKRAYSQDQYRLFVTDWKKLQSHLYSRQQLSRPTLN